jgi:hypothetical protein
VNAPERPIRVVLHRERIRERTGAEHFWLTLFRGALVIPHLIVLTLWSLLVLLLTPVNWLVVTVTGQLPEGVHEFCGRLVRCCVQVWAYTACLVDDYPRFDGAPDAHPVEVEIAPPTPQRRRTAALRPFLLLGPLALSLVIVGPGLLLSLVIAFWASGGAGLSAGSIAGTLTIGTWLSALISSRGPRPGIRELLLWALGYGAQVYGYALLLTDRFPDSGLALEPPEDRARSLDVRASLEDDGRRSRLVAFFRFELVAPHVAWLALWGLVLVPVTFVQWWVLLFRGRPLPRLYRFAAAFVRHWAHLNAFATYATRPFPGFVGETGRYPLELLTGPPGRQDRVRTLLRLPMVLPPMFLFSALTSAATLAALVGWVVGTILGRTTPGLRDLAAYCTRYGAQLLAFLLLVTDAYPDSGTASSLPPLDPDAPEDPWAGPPVWLTRPEAVIV